MARQQKIVYGIDFEVQKKSLENLKTQLNNIKNMSTKDFLKVNPNIDTKQAKQQLEQIKTTAKTVESALKKSFNPKINSTNITTFNAELQKSNLSLTNIYNDFSKAGPQGQRAFQTIANQVTNFNKKIRQTHSLLDKIGTTLTNTIKWNISSSLMDGVTQSIQQAWGFAKNLDSSLNDIRVVTGKSADEMARFAERANAVASNLGKGTTDYTRAALIYAQQGLGDKEVESRTAVTLKAANVTGQSTEAVSEELTAVWNGYKVSAEQAELYVDRLAAVASTTASNLQELSTGMSKVASAAAAMGVGEEQLAAQLSTIISVTKQAPETVGTALRTVYARITDIKAGVEEDGTTLGQYSGKMAEMGINVLDAAGNLRDMGTVMEEIGAKWGTMTREQQVYLAQTMAGQRQYSNLVALFDNFDKYNSALETAQNAEGTLAAQNEIHMESLNAHIQQLTTATEKMWMNLIDTDGIKNVIDSLTSIIDKVDYLFKSIGGGQNLLNSIGAIAMTLMSKNIAQGLSTTIANIKMAREETAEFKNQYKNVQEILAADDAARAANATRNNDEQQQTPLDDSFRGIIEDRGRLNQVSKAMSGDDFSETMTNLGQAANLTQRKNEILQSIQEIVDASGGKLESVKQFFDATDDEIMSLSDTIIDNLKIREKELNKQVSNVKEQQQTLASMDFEKATKEDIKDQTELIGLSVNDAFDNLNLKNATDVEKDAIRQIKEEWLKAQDSFADTKSLQDYHKNATQILGKLKGTLQSSTNDVKKASEEAANFIDEGGRKIKKQVGEIQQEIDNKTQQARGKIEQAARTVTIQGLTQFVSGITMAQGAINNLSSAIENVKKTGDIGSLFTSFLITAPMAISSLAQIESGLLKMTNTASISAAVQKILSFDIGKTAKATWGKITATLADIKATKAKIAANAGEIASEKGLAEAIGLTTTASVAAAAAIAGVVVALAALKVGFYIANEARRQEIEYNQKIIEQEKEKQQQYNKEKDIISEVEELNKKYEQGIITRTELKNQVEELQKKYGDQSVRIQKLIKDYKNLGQVIEQVKRERNQDEAISVQRERAAAQVNAQRTMEIMHKADHFKLFGQTVIMPNGVLAHITGKSSGQPTIQIQTNHGKLQGAQMDAARRLSSIMGEEGNIAKYGSEGGYLNTFVMANPSDYRSTKRLYDMLQQYINTAPEEQKKTKFYKDIVDMVDSMKSSIEQSQEAQIKQISNSAENAVLNSQTDFSKVNSTSDYLQQYNQLKAEIEYEIYKKNPVATPQEINQQINQALTAAIPEELQNMYGSKQQAIERLTSNPNLEQPADDVKQMIEALNSDQLDAFLHMDLENVESYDSIKQALKKISKLDFSNVEGLTEANLDAAIESYNKLQQILEAIQKGKKLSKKTIQEESGLTKEEIEEWFNQDVGGNYTVKAGKTQAEVEEFLKQKSVEEYRAAYRGAQKTIESNQAFLDAQKNNIVKSSDWKNQNQQAEKQFNWGISKNFIKEYKESGQNTNKLLDFVAEQRQFYNDNAYSKVEIGEDLLRALEENIALIDEPPSDKGSGIAGEAAAWGRKNKQIWKSIDYLLADAINGNNFTVSGEQKNISDQAIAETSDEIQRRIGKVNVQYFLDKGSTKTQNAKAKEQNKKNAKAMLDLIQQIDPTKADFAKNSDYRKHAQSGDLTEEEFNIIAAQYQAAVDKYKNANKDLQEAQKKAKEELNKIHEGLFAIDDDIDQTIVIKLGQQFQLTAKKSKLLDNALESNAKKAKDVAEEVQRYNSALSSVIKNYATWQDKLSGSTADKLSVAPQIKDAMADTLGISEITLSDTFATTKQNLEDMRLALEGDEKAYKRLQQAAYNDILLHVGLDDAELNEVKTDLSTYFDGLNLKDISVGAELNEQGLDQVLATLIAKGVKTEQQLEAIFASFDVDLDVVIEDGQAKILSYTKAATHELKEQEKSQEELKNLERDRIKNQKELTKYLRDDRDLYHEINILLQEQERIIKRISKNQDSMYGAELLKNLSAQTNELRKQQALLKSKQQMQLQDMANRKSALVSQGATFDSNGNIINYNNLIGSAMNKVNEIISRQNSIISAKNNIISSGGSTNDEAYKNLELQEFLINREKSNAQEYLSNLKSDLSAYESVKSDFEDVIDQLSDLVYQKIELRLKEFKVKVDVKYDLIQLQKDYDDFRRNIVEHDDILNPNKVKTILKDSAQYFSDALSSLNYLPSLADDLQKAINEANKFNDINYDPTQDSNAMFKTQGQAKTYLQQALEKVNSQSKDVLSNIDEIKNKILELANELKDVYTKQEQHLSFIREQINHDISLSKLLYGEENYKNLNKYYDQLKTYNLKSVEDAKSQQQMFLELYQKETDKALKDIYLQNYKQATKTLNSILESSLQDLKTRYENAINEVLKNTKEKLGFTYNTGLEWDLMKKQNDTFLDKVNSTFAIKNTEFLYNQAINDIDSITAQVKLKNVMNQQLEILKEKQQLTQYDVDRAQKVLDIQKARIALEQAQNNKTNMRLKRDSQGNYSYQFVADEDEIAKAQNNLDKTKNDLYNFDKEHYIENLNQAQELYEEYANKIREIKLNDNLNQTEKTRALGLLREDFEKRILKIWKQNEFIKRNLMDSTANSLKMNLQNMSAAEQNYFMGQSIPMWNSSAQQILNKFIDDPNSVYNEINDMYSSLIQVQNDYQSSIDQSLEKAGTSYEQFKKTGIDPVVDSMKELIKNNNELAKEANTIVEEMQPLKTTLGSLTDKWEEMRKKIEEVNDQIKDYLINMGKAALAAQNNGNNGSGIPSSGLPTQLTNYSTSGSASGGGATKPIKSNESVKNGQSSTKQPTFMDLKSALKLSGVPSFWDKMGGSGLPDKYVAQIRNEFANIKNNNNNQIGWAMKKALDKAREISPNGATVYGFSKDYVYTQTQKVIKSIVLDAMDKAAKSYGWGGTWSNIYGLTSNSGEQKLEYIAQPFSNKNDLLSSKGLLRQYWKAFDTGGYTGSWNSSDGKLAILHQKELVLNKQDTKNILNSVSLVRTITSNLTSNLMSQINSIGKFGNMTKTFMNDKFNQIEQNVKIQANFPNVNSKQEIEDAFAELVNMAAQRVLRKNN